MGYINPAFDPRMTRIGSPHIAGGRNLQRGRLQFDKSGLGVRFLYNPVAVSVSHFVNPFTSGSAAAKTAIANQRNLPGIGLGSSSFSLLFDRTYEVWDGKGLAGTYGCYVDVIAFYIATGVVDAAGVSSNSSTKKGPNPLQPPITTTTTHTTWNTYPTNGLQFQNTCYAFIGQKLRFYGYIDSLSITYTHFNASMIPTRCEVDLDLTWILGGPAGNNPAFGKKTTGTKIQGSGKGKSKSKGKKTTGGGSTGGTAGKPKVTP